MQEVTCGITDPSDSFFHGVLQKKQIRRNWSASWAVEPIAHGNSESEYVEEGSPEALEIRTGFDTAGGAGLTHAA